MQKWKLTVSIGIYIFHKNSLSKESKDRLKKKVSNICKRINSNSKLVMRGGGDSIWAEAKWMFSSKSKTKATAERKRLINRYVIPAIRGNGLRIMSHELRKIK
ncbi:hypothetical protein BMS3Abin15_00524 [bacterium BMS3Abin15]|nr:hypothetical protein BMS3Abin15_00524 [bacterium BMS3Abin15]HDH07642.1 hypothetical protein [Candidatus Moranbacteria bacterium]HDZ86036.1 hypothetical protein [Candidatus Moranbacteria bacterium]